MWPDGTNIYISEMKIMDSTPTFNIYIYYATLICPFGMPLVQID